jgi:indole-3-glycerol phosphate synthase
VADTILDRIVDSVLERQRAAHPAPGLEARARRVAEQRWLDGPRSLRAALERSGVSVIAECKHASPSAGVLREPFDPVALARAYETGGAAAISVVTEPDHFGGRPGWIAPVRRAVSLPALRKDFVVTERQLYETVLAGADAVLLIQRILAPERLAELLELAAALHLEVLLELFADEDPGIAVASGAEIIGVNARDLGTFEVDLGRVEAMAARIPAGRVRVAESGIHGPDDVARLSAAGYDAFLVGEHLVRSTDPQAALRELIGVEDERREPGAGSREQDE